DPDQLPRNRCRELRGRRLADEHRHRNPGRRQPAHEQLGQPSRRRCLMTTVMVDTINQLTYQYVMLSNTLSEKYASAPTPTQVSTAETRCTWANQIMREFNPVVGEFQG